jgi:hypothetical protein
MKIYEIVSEEKVDEGVLGLAARGLARLVRPVGSKVDPSSVASQYGTRFGAMRGAARTSAHLKNIPLIGNTLHRWNIKNSVRAFELAKIEVARTITNNLGKDLMDIVLLFNLGDAVVNYFAAKEVLDNANPPVPDYEVKLNELRGILVAQILAPGVAVGMTKVAGGLAKIIPHLMTKIPVKSVAKSGASTKLVIDALQKVSAASLVGLLTTEKGIKLVTDWLGTSVTQGLGAATTMLWNLCEFLYAGLQVAGVIPKDDNQQADKEKSAAGSKEKDKAGSSTPSASDIGGAVAQGMTSGGSVDDIAANFIAGQLGKSLSK